MKRKTLIAIAALIMLTMLLTACSGLPLSRPAVAAPENQPPAQEPLPDQAGAAQEPESVATGSRGMIVWTDGQAKLDEQGAVTVEVTYLNLNNPGETLDFQITLNTHSVDLSMDLAQLATLTTDTGKTVQASKWSAPVGGHHVGGELTFPATIDGKPVLDGAHQLTLTIKDLDAPARVFAWER